MELPHLGQSCVICRREDYLPFKCEHCDKIVCIDHKADHGEDCPLNSIHSVQLNERKSNVIVESLKKACNYCSKITLKLELVECQYCKGQHCLHHRHQVQHDCRELNEKQELTRKEKDERAVRQKIALERLKESCKVSTSSSTYPVKPDLLHDPKKRDLVKRIRLMKIRQSAKGPSNILQEDKIYFQIKFLHEPSSALSDSNKNGKEVRVYTTSKHTIGRMIDYTADELSLRNKNHIDGASQLVFIKQLNSDETIILDSQKTFSYYLNNETIENGDELIITYSKE